MDWHNGRLAVAYVNTAIPSPIALDMSWCRIALPTDWSQWKKCTALADRAYAEQTGKRIEEARQAISLYRDLLTEFLLQEIDKKREPAASSKQLLNVAKERVDADDGAFVDAPIVAAYH